MESVSTSRRPSTKAKKGMSIGSLLAILAFSTSCTLALSLYFLLRVETRRRGTIPLPESSPRLRKQAPAKKDWAKEDEQESIYHDVHNALTVSKNESAVIDMRQLNYELPFDNPDGGAWKQGWDVQPVPLGEPLNVLVIPHSHCDPGWIKTFDDYFQSQTQEILTSVIDALKKDKRRKFIWAEISYFEWWWREQDEETHKVVRNLLSNGQLEFVTAGWVQPDEANSELYAMEIQLQEGHDWVRATFGEDYIPHYGWAIDPFGYSPSMAWLLQKYGFRGMLIQRVHYAIKKELAKRKHLEFFWRQTWDDKGDSKGEHDIFTHVMPFFSYDVPHTCGPDPSVCCQFDFKRMGGGGSCPWGKPPQVITDANIKERSMLLWDQYRKKASLYRSNTVLVPLGDDFRYQTAKETEAQYTNYQKIFDYINKNVPAANVRFGTLSEYFQHAMGSFEVPILKGSFFTYSDVNEDYWSGYYTSRVFDKALDRQLERVLFAAEAMGGGKEDLQGPRRALSLFQHHDGVTGTAKNHVVEDYAKRMYDAIHDVNIWITQHVKRTQGSLLAASGIDSPEACLKAPAPRSLETNHCSGKVLLFNPLPTLQKCGEVSVEGHSFANGEFPCRQTPVATKTSLVFDQQTGLLLKPVREEWKVWQVRAGGAYLFVPGQQVDFNMGSPEIHDGGFVVNAKTWKRSIEVKEVPSELGKSATVIDFIYETQLQTNNEEWVARFSADISNSGYFHTDLNGFNFDTHRFRSDLPKQSQVFPMPTLASVEDNKSRLTVLSEHAQGTASFVDGSIDVWLDRRLSQDDSRGLGQGVQDNRPTRTRFCVVLETEGFDALSDDFKVTPITQRMWDELQHPLLALGTFS